MDIIAFVRSASFEVSDYVPIFLILSQYLLLAKLILKILDFVCIMY